MSDTGNILIDAFNLPPKEASDLFSKKDNRHSWYYAEVWEEAHARSFTVAKAMTADILQDIRDSLQKGIDSGESYGAWKARIEPVLRAKGWWGLVPANMVPGAPPNAGSEPVMLGSPHRLENIFRTNIQSAYQAGRYNQMMQAVKSRPYWQYVAVLDGRTRPAHKAMNGKVYPADDPVWDFAYPPNGYRCRCTVRSLSKSEVDRDGLTVDNSDGNVTTETVSVNKSKGYTADVSALDLGGGKKFMPDPGFNSNNAKVAWEPDPSKYSPAIRQQLTQATSVPAAPLAVPPPTAIPAHPATAPIPAPAKKKSNPAPKKRVAKPQVVKSVFEPTGLPTIAGKDVLPFEFYEKLGQKIIITRRRSGTACARDNSSINLRARDIKTKKGARRSIQHEFGHALFNAHTAQMSAFAQQIIDEVYKKLPIHIASGDIAKFGDRFAWSKIITDKSTKLGKTFSEVSEEIADVADMASAASNETYGTGHPKGYFYDQRRKLTEVFAESTSIRYSGNEIFKEYFPEAHNLIVTLYDGLLQ